ncbi:CvpA family protein [Treponema sp. C6A8]|uniref:CvpA family protein n=1 Tax=Treponema sp. C6A8 TaxID=1410609 RepID=UPI000480C633|nr:CvpA family protein [Treponema sp. C6A8]
MTFVPVDYFFCILIVIFGLVAFCKGFLAEVFGKAAWVLGIIAGAFFYKKVAAALLTKINSPIACNILGFLIVFVTVFLLVKICEMILQKIFQVTLLKSLDRGLGLLFGLAEGFAIVCLIIFVLRNQPFVDIGNLLNDSFFAHLMGEVLASPLLQKNGGAV